MGMEHWWNDTDRGTPKYSRTSLIQINPLNAQVNSICHLLALLGAHHIIHISRIRVN